jgi:hypothetical protein
MEFDRLKRREFITLLGGAREDGVLAIRHQDVFNNRVQGTRL